MTSLFDGMAGLLIDVFGGPVTYTPEGGTPRDIISVFRREPTEATDSEGHDVLVMAPTWTVTHALAPEVKRGDRILPADGITYEIQNVWPSGSPAVDARVICELYEVD
ncbi:MAG: hypothetical protein HWE26_17095 [Alteromonadaceae bacterium]|nr:hypothetical protein [Alteromonadaceae bacterium]